MSQLRVPAVARFPSAATMAALPAPTIPLPRITIADAAPLFRFMRDAEQRFDTLRMTIVDRQVAARGEIVARSDVWLRHPGSSRLVVSGPGGGPRGAYHVWVVSGETVSHYDANANVVRSRPRLPIPAGADSDPDLPGFGRVYRPRTPLPAGSLADTFVHPHGFCRNVLATGPLSRLDAATGATGREMTLVRCDHPRSAKVLLDRPDHWLLLGVDRQTGLILLLEEHIGDEMTRRAEVTALVLDEPIGDEHLTLHLPADVRRLY